MNFIKRLFNKNKKLSPPQFSQEQFDQDYELKEQALETILGPLHELVGHAIIPFAIGGAVDMYYYPHHIEGTGFATMELLDPAGNGPLPNRLGTYELVAFTRHKYETSEDPQTPFNKIERRICGIFTHIGFFSAEAVLNPSDTCELPKDDEENICLIFDKYPSEGNVIIGNRQHHLLLCIEIHRSELDFAREEGSDQLLQKLKQAGVYPYSDIEREAVV